MSAKLVVATSAVESESRPRAMPASRAAHRSLMPGFVVQIANDPARRFRIIWYFFARTISIALAVIGSLYFGGGNRAAFGPGAGSLRAVTDLEGSLNVHGALLLGFSLFALGTLSDYRKITRVALIACALYTFWVGVMITASAILFHGSWGAPVWYFASTVWISFLVIIAPPLGSDGRRWRGTERGRSA